MSNDTTQIGWTGTCKKCGQELHMSEAPRRDAFTVPCPACHEQYAQAAKATNQAPVTR